jgi:hypothetical protein
MKQRTKIRFNLRGNPVGGETIWAEQVGENIYRLLNIPLYAAGYAEGDIVHCSLRNGWYEVVNIEKDNGNGTVWIMFTNAESLEAQEVLNELASVGCAYERATDQFVAVNVPPTLDIPFSQMANYLDSISKDIIAEWAVSKRLTRSKAPE